MTHPTLHALSRTCFSLSLMIFMVTGCDSSAQTADRTGDADRLFVTNATVIDVQNATVLSGWTIVIDEGRFIQAGPQEEIDIPPGEAVLDADGQYAVPGLADMHVHLNEDELGDYLQAGVTTVRNLWGWPGLKEIIDGIESGGVTGPWIYAMSPGLDAAPQYWPYTQFVEQPSEAASVVQKQVDDGWSTLKLYADLSRPSYDAIVSEARRHGLTYGGHVSADVGILHALSSGHRFVEHLTGYTRYLSATGQGGAFGWRQIDESRIPELIDATLAAGAWNCPTLAIYARIARGDETIIQNRRRFVKRLFDSGSPLLVGTDSGIGQTQPGVSIHEEMAEFVAAGISPADVLRITTVDAARFLDAENEFGQIRPGLRADMLLVDDNPLKDLSTLREPWAVFARGVRVK